MALIAKEMTLTAKQRDDIEVSLYFCPERFKRPITEEDREEFIAWSERGTPPREYYGLVKEAKNAKNPIILGKSRRGLTLQMWEEGILENTTYYRELIADMPRSVVDFVKKEMFQGKDADVIEKLYQSMENSEAER